MAAIIQIGKLVDMPPETEPKEIKPSN